MSSPRLIQQSLTTKLEDLDFTDDASLLPNQFNIQLWTSALCETAKPTGLEINPNKTKSLRENTQNTVAIMLKGNSIEDVSNFTYVGNVVSKDGAPMRTSR